MDCHNEGAPFAPEAISSFLGAKPPLVRERRNLRLVDCAGFRRRNTASRRPKNLRDGINARACPVDPTMPQHGSACRELDRSAIWLVY